MQNQLQLFLPILILLPILYFRMRKLSRPHPLKLKRLWIRPVIILLACALVLFAPQPGTHLVRHFSVMDWGWRWSNRWRNCMAAKRCCSRCLGKAPQ